MIAFRVETPPVPKGRPRVGNGRAYTPSRTVAFEAAVRAAWVAAGCPRVEGPLRVTVELDPAGVTVTLEEIDVTRSKLRGDVDNYVKAVLDAVQDKTRNGVTDPGAFADDRQVHELVVVKR